MTTDVVYKGEGNDTFGSRKLGLSCAECRRSKLKCDRIFPCQSCIRRGCPGICPDGTLAATKGNKVLMAQAQRLSEQVKSLSSRVRELEAALAQSRSTEEKNNAQTRLDADVFHDEDTKAVSEAIGSLSLGIDGQAKYHGESAGSEYLQDLLPKDEAPSSQRVQLDLPNEISVLMTAFPFGFKECPYDKSIFIPYLPPRQRALELAYIYYRSVAWMYDPISSDDFTTSILEPIYGIDNYPSTDALHSHRLAVFFMVLANGNLYDSHPSATSVAEQYYALARAALCLDSVLVEVTCATVQALFLIFRFIYNANQVSKEERWLLTGLATRVAQTIGLQRDSAAWNLETDEIQRRRRLFWELFTWENWSSLVHGRPGSLLVQHTDCKFPFDLDPFIDASGKRELGFHAWKYRYSAECLSISVEHVFSIRTPPYATLLTIDQKIRNYAIPKHLRCPGGSDPECSWSSDPGRALQQYCALCVRDSNLLYIHRSYFAQAIREAPDNPLRHKYKPSVLATYRAACRLIFTLRSLSPVCPLASTVWFFWSGIFSSCVILGALVVESPGCTLAKDAMGELENTLPFFEEGSRQCRPPSVWTFLQKLHKRASLSYTAFQTGQSTNTSNSGSPDQPDELEVVGGRKSVITTRSNPNSPSLVTSGSPSSLNQDVFAGSSPSSQPATSDLPMEYYHTLDASANPAQKGQMDDIIRRFEDHAYSLTKTTHHSMPSEQVATTHLVSAAYIPDSASLPVPSGFVSHTSNQDVSADVTNSWHSAYALQQHAYSQQISATFLPYTPNPVHLSHTSPTYGYQQRSLQEQCQADIWGTYMMGFES